MIELVSFKSFFHAVAISPSAASSKISRVRGKGVRGWSINFYCPLNRCFIHLQELLEKSICQERNSV